MTSDQARGSSTRAVRASFAGPPRFDHAATEFATGIDRLVDNYVVATRKIKEAGSIVRRIIGV